MRYQGGENSLEEKIRRIAEEIPSTIDSSKYKEILAEAERTASESRGELFSGEGSRRLIKHLAERIKKGELAIKPEEVVVRPERREVLQLKDLPLRLFPKFLSAVQLVRSPAPLLVPKGKRRKKMKEKELAMRVFLNLVLDGAFCFHGGQALFVRSRIGWYNLKAGWVDIPKPDKDPNMVIRVYLSKPTLKFLEEYKRRFRRRASSSKPLIAEKKTAALFYQYISIYLKNQLGISSWDVFRRFTVFYHLFYVGYPPVVASYLYGKVKAKPIGSSAYITREPKITASVGSRAGYSAEADELEALRGLLTILKYPSELINPGLDEFMQRMSTKGLKGVEYVVKWIKYMRRRHFAVNSIKAYVSDVVHILQDNVFLHPKEISYEDIEEILSSSALAPSTLRRRKFGLRNYFTFLKEKEGITGLPDLSEFSVKGNLLYGAVVTRKEFNYLIEESLKDDNLFFFVFLARFCGMRAYEIATTKLTHVRLAKKPYVPYLIVERSQTKSSAGVRAVPILQPLFPDYRSLFGKFWGLVKEKRKKGSIYLIEGEDRAKLAHRYEERVRRIFAGGLKVKKSLHTLRHTFASELFLKGISIEEISHWLGHASRRTTVESYIHTIPELQGRILKNYEKSAG